MTDISALYAQTEPMMVGAIAHHADSIPGLFPFVDGMRDRKVKTGSCTGDTAPMMENRWCYPTVPTVDASPISPGDAVSPMRFEMAVN